MRRKVPALTLAASLALPAFSQTNVRETGPMTPNAVRKADQPMTKAIAEKPPAFVLPDRYKDRTAFPLPAKFNLGSASPYFTPYDPTIPGLWEEQGMSCGNATAVSALYSHEANRELDFKPAAKAKSAEYSYEFTYHFLNNGDMLDGDFWMSFAAMDILKEIGCASTVDFGGVEWGNSFAGWMSGYDKYYRAMKLRLDEYYRLDATAPGSENAIKQVLLDRGEGAPYGAAVQTHVSFSSKIEKRKMQGPNGAQTSVYYNYAAGGGHSMSIVGWDDTFLPELGGAWIMQDTYPVGHAYSPRVRWKAGSTLDFTGVGAPILFQKIKHAYSPKVTLKIQLTHNQRGNIAVMTGVGPASGTLPIAWKDYAGAFNYSGGANPMGGRGQSGTLEFGLDMTDFAAQLALPGQKLYLMIHSKGGVGSIDKLSIMDYTAGAAKEIASTEAPKPIAPGTSASPVLTTLAIAWPGNVSIRDARSAKEPPIAWMKAGSIRIRLTDAAATRATLNVRDLRGRTLYASNLELGTAKAPYIDFTWAGASATQGFATVELSNAGKTIRTGTVALKAH